MNFPKRKYKCVKCGCPTINNQVVGSYCPICWDELIVTKIDMPIFQNLRKWLKNDLPIDFKI